MFGTRVFVCFGFRHSLLSLALPPLARSGMFDGFLNSWFLVRFGLPLPQRFKCHHGSFVSAEATFPCSAPMVIVLSSRLPSWCRQVKHVNGPLPPIPRLPISACIVVTNLLHYCTRAHSRRSAPASVSGGRIGWVQQNLQQPTAKEYK